MQEKPELREGAEVDLMSNLSGGFLRYYALDNLAGVEKLSALSKPILSRRWT